MEFERLKLLINEKIEHLFNKTILILGTGGVGGYVIESLARSGIGHLILIDFDNVDITNFNRQLIATYDNLGKKKILCYKERIKNINKNCLIDTYDIFYNESNKDIIFQNKIDYVIDCCDTLDSKKIIIEECLKRNIPIISCMGTGNKFHPELLKIEKLKKTCYDTLAKKLRYLLKDNKEALNIDVLYSKEEPIKGLSKIGSTSYVPSCAGLLIASYVINEFLEE